MNYDKALAAAERVVKARAELAAAEVAFQAAIENLGQRGLTPSPKPANGVTPKPSNGSTPTRRKGREGSVAQQVKKLLAVRGALSVKELVEELKADQLAVRSALAYGKKKGDVKQANGKYELIEKK